MSYFLMSYFLLVKRFPLWFFNTLFFIALLMASAYSLAYSLEQEKETILKSSPHLRKFLETFNGSAQIKEVRNLGSLYELVISFPQENRLVYLTKDLEYLILGALYDKEAKNVTHLRSLEVNRMDITSLPLDLALLQKTEMGNSSKMIILFLDPFCPYCKKLVEFLKGSVKQNFDLYVFFYPLSERSREASIRLVCSNLPFFEAYEKLDTLSSEICETGKNLVDLHSIVGQSLNLRGTPFVILGDGTNFFGMMLEPIKNYLEK